MPRITEPQKIREALLPAQAQRCPALDWRHVRVTGAEAESFLQGQLTLDLARLGSDAHALTAWCTGKGRVWTLLRIWREDEGFGLLVPTTLLDRFLPRLQMFVLRAKVTLQAEPTPISGLLGPATAEAPGLAGARSLPLAAGQQLLIGATDESLPTSDVARWTALRLLDGEAQIGPDSQERFLPQALGLAPGAGLDFNKGCYVGQEIVARVHYRGRCPEQLALFENPSEDELAGRTVLADLTVDDIRLVQAIEKITV